MASTHNRYPTTTTSNNNDFRLPSLKDLNFQYRPPAGPTPVQNPPQTQQQQQPVEQPPPQQEYPSNIRHASWARSSNPPPPIPQQHTPPLSAGHDTAPKQEYHPKHENGGYVHPGIPLSAQVAPLPGSVNIGPPRTDDPPHSPNQSKRPRVRQNHPSYLPPQYASYPPAQPPPATPYHQIPNALPHHPAPPPPPPHEQQVNHHPPPVSAHPPYQQPQYQYIQTRQPVIHQQHPPQPTLSNPYPSPGPPQSAPPPQGPWVQQPQQHPSQHLHQQPPQQPLQQHLQQQHPSHNQPQHHQQPPPPAHIPPNPSYIVPQHHLQQAPPPAPTQPPQPTQHQQHQFQLQSQQQLPYGRTTAIIPTSIDTRPVYALPPSFVATDPASRDKMAEISDHCTALYNFAHRYAQLPHIQPTQVELEEMSNRALQVVRLLEELKGLNAPPVEQNRVQVSEAIHESPDDPRPPKRPWEDISQDEGAPAPEQNSSSEQYLSTDVKPPQSTAEQDMELIRTKRATSTATSNGPTGQPKSKYRKRSRATPPGKCHSCNIRETPEWRRGPDGARTLCNACGLHYAKLIRKRDKTASNGETPHIDMETLRASARAADIADKATRSSKQAARSHHSEPASPIDVKQQTPQQHHQSSFQLVNIMGTDQSSGSNLANSSDTNSNRTAPPPSTPTHSNMPPPSSLPPPPWSTSNGRPYAPQDHLQQQSFMRGSTAAR